MEKLLSIIFSVLLITGTMAPAVMAAEPSTTPLSSEPGERVQFDSTRSAQSPSEGVSTNRSALDLRDRALDTLENSPRSRGKKAPTEDLRSTYRYVLDDRRVNSSRIFDTDRTVVARTQRHQPSVATDLATADHFLARTAVDDADRVSAMLDERGIEYDEEATAESIAEAAADLEKADRLRSNGQLVAAVVHSEKAWVNAQEALAEMDDAVEPVVTITYREDPPHEGRFNYTLEGTVFDVHTANHEAKGTVNENDRYLPLNTSTVPGEVATFNETVQLDDRANVVTVTVTNPPDEYVEIDAKGRPDHARGYGGAKADSKRGDGKKNSNDPSEKSDRSAWGGSGGSLIDEPQIGTDTLRLDGDGLPDRYETETTGTDRLDPDSNSTFTDRNESAIGALDGMKDLDVDRLTNYEEYLIGTEPLENDTDGDGLLDGWEVHIAGTDPLDDDSFDDGVSDGDRDLSGDGLALLDDQEHGTNPRVRDTDRDELTDYEEIHVYDTDPLDPDTSGDGLFDGEKARLDLDPAANDTAPDGTPASERTYTTSTTNESSGVTVVGTGPGVVADGIHVRDETATGSVNGSVGPTVRVMNTTDFDHATVTIPIQEPIDGENLTVVKWDPTTDASWRAVETEIDAANRTASANVTSFSYFTVATDSFGSAFSETIQPRWPTLDDFRSVRNWDTSGAVSHDAGIVTLESAFPEDERDDGDDSDGNDDDDYDPCKDPRILGSDVGIQKCHDDGGNDDDEGDNDYDPCEDPRILGSDVGIQKCHDDDDEDDQPDDPRILDAGGESTASTTDAALPNSSRISRTLTVEPGAKNARLEARIASSTPEKTSFVNAYVEGESGTKAVYEKSGGQVGVRSGSTWQRVRADLSQFEGEDVTVHFETTNDAKLRVDYVGLLTDSAGNGIPDTVEEMDLRMPAGQPGVVGTPLELDPRRADTDGDGLRDDEEVDIEWGYTESGDGLWALEAEVTNAVAHPARYDTVNNDLSDFEELEIWGTNPFLADTSGDGYIDSVDPDPLTDLSPPDVEVHPNGAASLGESVIVRTRSEVGIESVSVNGYYTPKYVDDPYWQLSEPERYQRNEEWERWTIDIHQHGWNDEPPEVYFVNVTDEFGNSVTVPVESPDDGESGTYGVTGATVFLGGTTTTGGIATGGSAVLSSTGIGLLLVGTAVAIERSAARNYQYEAALSGGEVEVGTILMPPVAAASYEQVWSGEDVIGLPEELIISLPSGAIYEDPTGQGYDRGYGWEHIKDTPGINDVDDVGEIIRFPNAIEQDGRYTLVIGDNPNGPGQIIIRLLGPYIVSASNSVYDPHTEEELEVPPELYDKIIHQKDDWDHNVVGNSKEEIYGTIQKVINGGADEVWKDPNQDRRMYVSEVTINDEQIVFVVFVMDGVIRSIFAPTHKQATDGPEGQFKEWIEYYIKSQEMVKEYLSKEIVQDVDIGEQSRRIPMPDPR